MHGPGSSRSRARAPEAHEGGAESRDAMSPARSRSETADAGMGRYRRGPGWRIPRRAGRRDASLIKSGVGGVAGVPICDKGAEAVLSAILSRWGEIACWDGYVGHRWKTHLRDYLIQ